MVSYSTVKFDMTSQVNTHNLIKFGLETRMHDMKMNGMIFSSPTDMKP
ncbi:MAG: hypothetical protein H8D46_00170 [FCB group bacterium]|nr:hypothetical protein [FCB group bacterium]